MADKILQVKNLKTYFHTEAGLVKAVNDVSFDVEKGKTLGIVGESGCGKSMTSLSIMRLIKKPGQIEGGEILLEGKDIVKMSEDEMRKIRGKKIAMIFQEPMTSLNPAFTLGDQLSEAVMRHQDVSRAEAMKVALQILEKVQIPAAEMRLKAYPHQLSGGMRQRVMIAMALINHPKLLIADEPTTALDVTIQAQILALLNALKEETGTAVLMITHDLGVVAEVAQQVAVMYAGQVVEQGSVEAIFADPQHPYTIGLMGSIPSLGARKGPLSTIPGSVPLPESMPQGCRFATRCPFAQSRCHDEKPPLTTLGAGHRVACFRVPLEHHIALGETA